MGTMTEQVSIHVLRHKTTGLLLAVSDELKGLNVAGRTLEEVLAELPAALEMLLSAIKQAEVCVLGVEIDSETATGWAEYETKVLATYQLKAA